MFCSLNPSQLYFYLNYFQMSFDNSDKISGFLLEYNSTQFMVFDTEQHLLKRGRISYDGNLELTLGKFYIFNHGKTPRTYNRACEKDIEFYPSRRNQGQMLARTWAVAPGDDLPLETQEEYEGKVWSPWLGLLNDTNGIFEKKFGKGGYGAVRNETQESISMKVPWSKVSDSETEKIIPGRYTYASSTSCARYALCVQDAARNPLYNEKAVGSTKTCSHFVSKKYGVVRYLNKAKLGTWYDHSFKNPGNHTFSMKTAFSVYYKVRARKIMEIQPPLPTEIINNKIVEVTMKFNFDHDEFENPWSRGITNWNERKEGVRKNINICNDYLGMVKVFLNNAVKIIKRAENLQRESQSKRDPISVIVKVRPFGNFVWKNNDHPDHALFQVHSVVGVEYAN
ncbi:hypothetical protein CRE_12083 [Caenorhabditis remanei]|uniref:Uncharacterized protein n=1 Tax=Caenorhabditis remanei TaxID=31234 RepID=E3MPT6_CAERE|nr:hypothetical protein CRE_12083 [Caenorhabditis remanei]